MHSGGHVEKSTPELWRSARVSDVVCLCVYACVCVCARVRVFTRVRARACDEALTVGGALGLRQAGSGGWHGFVQTVPALTYRNKPETSEHHRTPRSDTKQDRC